LDREEVAVRARIVCVALHLMLVLSIHYPQRPLLVKRDAFKPATPHGARLCPCCGETCKCCGACPCRE
jgi:hypothetical protein